MKNDPESVSPAAMAADRASLLESPFIRPFLALAFSVCGLALRLNPRGKTGKRRSRQRHGNSTATQRPRRGSRRRRGNPPKRRPSVSVTTNLNLEGRRHG